MSFQLPQTLTLYHVSSTRRILLPATISEQFGLQRLGGIDSSVGMSGDENTDPNSMLPHRRHLSSTDLEMRSNICRESFVMGIAMPSLIDPIEAVAFLPQCMMQ